MLIWNPKYPDDIAPYGIDWSATLVTDEIATSVWETISGDATLASAAYTAQATSVVVSGGTETTVFKNTITSVGGYLYVEEVTLAINDPADPSAPRTTRKRVLIEMCVEELRLAGYEWNFTPEEYVSTLRRLDAIGLEFDGCGYNSPATFGAGEIDELSGLLDADVRDFALLLAEATAPAVGKTLSPTSLRRITRARIKLTAKYSSLPVVSLAPGTPLGAGNRRRWTSGRGTFASGTAE